MLQRGDLPVLARLIDGGGRAVLRAEPPLYSPVVWTTLATGFPPSEHGVTQLEMPDPTGDAPILAASFHRRRAALWQMVSAGGKDVGIVGWWTRWPAEPVRGTLVSDRLARSRWTEWADGSKDMGLVWPPSLAETLAGHRVDPASPPMDELRALLPMTPEEEEEMLAAERPIFAHGLSVLKFAWCAQRTYENVALSLVPGPSGSIPRPSCSSSRTTASGPLAPCWVPYRKTGTRRRERRP